MKSIKTIAIVVLASSLFYFVTPSTHTMEADAVVHSGSTINQMVIDTARIQGIDIDSVDINESRDLTIHNSKVDAGNLRPGEHIKVTVVYRK